jgi:hypothetical protein
MGAPTSLTTHLTMFMVLILAIIGVAGTTFLFYVKDDSAGATRILGFSGAIITGLLAIRKTEITHLTVNSRLDQFTDAIETIARAEGRAEGVKAGRAGENGPPGQENPE